jgi:hypothetical protein
MRSHWFGRKIKLPATIAIKHQIKMLMALDEVKKQEAQSIQQLPYLPMILAPLPITTTNSSGRALP